MKKLILLLGALAFAAAGGADSFVQQLTPEERAAAGLDGLSPGQQAALDRLAERYAREGSRVAVAQAREEAKAEAKAEVRAEVKAEVKAEVEHAVKKNEESKFGLAGSKGHAEAIRSRISGTFKGWSGRTLFVLENGQQWVQADPSDNYWATPQPGPEVEIRQSSIGGWKLFIMPDGRWVRVRRVN